MVLVIADGTYGIGIEHHDLVFLGYHRIQYLCTNLLSQSPSSHFSSPTSPLFCPPAGGIHVGCASPSSTFGVSNAKKHAIALAVLCTIDFYFKYSKGPIRNGPENEGRDALDQVLWTFR